MLTSTFSHSTGGHFLFNMIALYSFGNIPLYQWVQLHNIFRWSCWNQIWGCPINGHHCSRYKNSPYEPPNPTSLSHEGGVGSSLASHIFKHVTRSTTPSLGISGSVFALAAASTYINPDARMAIIFLPFWRFETKLNSKNNATIEISFPASHGLLAFVTYDTVGCVLRYFNLRNVPLYRMSLDVTL
jgi:rhomboid-like protein